MEMLGLPLEERKKAYAGVDLSSLITKYNQAEKQGDLPTMLALLDIIKAAPKGKTPPMTTVKDDIMAQAMPQPMPQMQPQASVPGFEGAVTALENQQMPVSGMANGGPVMNVMRDGDAYDDQPGRDEYAEGGVIGMQGGGRPPLPPMVASYPVDEDERRRAMIMASPQMVDFDKRAVAGRLGMSYPIGRESDVSAGLTGIAMSTPEGMRARGQSYDLGAGTKVGPGTLRAQIERNLMNNQNRYNVNYTVPYAEGGVVKMTAGGLPPYNIATASMDDLIRFAQFGDPKAGEELTRRQMSGFQYRPISQLNTPMPPGVSAQQAFANRPGGVPGAMPLSPSPAVTPGAAVPPASTTPPSLFSRAKDAVKLAGKGIGFLGKATPFLYAAQPLEANAGEEEALAKLRLIDTLNLKGEELQLARDLAMSPKVSYDKFVSKYVPANTAVASATPPPPAAGGPSVPGISGLDLSAFKPRSAEEETKRSEDYIASQVAAGKIRSEEDIKKDFEAFRTEGKTRAEADRAAAKEAFKENILLNAALAAPQFLRGRGLDQATARFSEAFAPMALETASQKTKAIKEANKYERDSDDKFRLAQIDMDKAARATAEGRFAKGQELEQKATQNYLAGSIQLYSAQLQAQAHLLGMDKIVASEMLKGARERAKTLQLNEQFRKLPIQDQERLIQSIMQQAIPGISGIQTNRPPIQNVPG
jgi:hypothetical protein